MSHVRTQRPIALSIGIIARNEEGAIVPLLASLFRQSVFERIAERHERCEILVVANACTDGTVRAAQDVFARLAREHDWAGAWSARVIALPESGRNNAWNRFVHEFSALEARYLVTLHANILLHHCDALSSLVSALDRRRHVNAASGRRCEDLLFKERKTFWERLAVTSPAVDGSAGGQLNGELVCLRADVARRIYLPAGLDAGFDRFLTQVVGTDFFSTRFDPTRIALPPDAAHICAAHVGVREVLDCRKRRMIGQTAAHVLTTYLAGRPWRERASLVETLRNHEMLDRNWLEKLIAAHVRRRRFFGQLFPGVLRVRSCALPGWRRIRQIPETCTGFALTVIACLRAYRLLRARSETPDVPSTSEVVLSGSRLEPR